MTIRMLQAWNGLPEQLVTTLSGGEESRLVGLGLASFDLDGPADNVRMAQIATDAGGNVFGMVVNTIADLKALSAGQFLSVQVLGYYAAGDGGGGVFRWNGSSTAADNGGTVIIPDSAPGTGRWERLYQTLDVKKFGAVGDGVTDDTAAIQAAITQCLASKKDLLVPSGTYKYSPASTFNIPLTAEFSIIGEGESKFLIDFNGVVFNVTSNPSFRFTVRGVIFTLLNPTTTNTNSTCFYISNGTSWGANFFFEDVIANAFTNCFLHAIRAYNSGGRNLEVFGPGRTIVSCACIRIWGADGTLTPQDHSFSNLNRFENCKFYTARVGVDGFSLYNSGFYNCTFEINYIAFQNALSVATGTVTISTEKGGFGVGFVDLENCWFEQSSLYHITNINVDPATGADIDPTFISTVTYSTNTYFTGPNFVRQSVVTRPIQTRYTAFKYLNGTAYEIAEPGVSFFNAFTENPSRTYYSFNNIGAEMYVPLVVTPFDSATIPVSGNKTTGEMARFTASQATNGQSFTEHRANDSAGTLIRTRTTAAGSLNLGAVATISNHPLRFYTNNSFGLEIDTSGNTLPYATTGTLNLGSGTFRWNTLYATNGTINTSDEREKQDIAQLDAAEKRVATALKGLVRKFRFKDSVDLKGDAARIHIGVIAQEVAAAFEAEGLDPMRYGIVCYDQWDEQPEQVNDEGVVTRPCMAAGERFGIRYDELLAFIIGAL